MRQDSVRSWTQCALLGTVLLLAGPALAGIMDPELCTLTRTYPGPETLIIVSVPDGSGTPFDQARLPQGGTADGTLTMRVVDGGGYPIPGYPYEDIWIMAPDGGMVACPGGACPDRNTDANGETVWVTPMQAGGWSRSGCLGVVSGMVLVSPPPAIDFASPDLTGNLKVDLQDLGMFAVDYFGVYAFRSDLYPDGIINLSDLGILAGAYGVECP